MSGPIPCDFPVGFEWVREVRNILKAIASAGDLTRAGCTHRSRNRRTQASHPAVRKRVHWVRPSVPQLLLRGSHSYKFLSRDKFQKGVSSVALVRTTSLLAVSTLQ